MKFELEIYNCFGDLISSENIAFKNEDNYYIQLDKYESGIYYLLLKSSNLLIKKKLIIVK